MSGGVGGSAEGGPQKSNPAVLPRERVLHEGAHAEELGAHGEARGGCTVGLSDMWGTKAGLPGRGTQEGA